MYKKNLVFAGACAGMLLFGVTLITLGSIATDLQARYVLDAISTGTLFSILPIGILVGSLIFGPVIDRFGYKLLLILACLGMFAGFQGIAFASGLAALKISIFVFGVGSGIINGATNALVADISEEYRGANLSLLGVFFGLGALGMPLVLGAVSGRFEPFQVLSAVGWLTVAVGIYYSAIALPPAKRHEASAAKGWRRLFTPLLILIAFFLFWQSALEAIINNWTTTYVTTRGVMSESNALYALSLHICGMVVMRLLTGSVFRRVSQVKIMWACLTLFIAGGFLMQVAASMPAATGGLILSGAGLAGGFPIMLGFVGERFSEVSGTAFSFVFVVALIGNMLVNFLMGLIVHNYGVAQLTTVAYIGAALMALLFIFIVRRLDANAT
jgi:FHS family glucose/mannose:H+ symporter-like MFS transporter